MPAWYFGRISGGLKTTAKPPSFIAEIAVPRRIWAVAAIHGEAPRLVALHEALADRARAGDRLVYLGNYLGHGGHVLQVVDELLAFRRWFLTLAGMEPWDIVYLRGSQEEMWHKLLQIQIAMTPAEVFDWMMEKGADATLKAYGGDPAAAHTRFREGVMATTRWTGQLREAMKSHPGHDALLSGLSRAALTDSRSLLFVHAGVDPVRPLGTQGDRFWWGSSAFPTAEPYDGFRLVVHGFDPAHRGLKIGPVSANLDAGCGFGGPLTAVCFAPDGEVLDQVQT